MISHGIGANQFFFGVVAGLELIENRVAQFLSVKRLRFDPFRENIHAKAGKNGIFQAFKIPIRKVNFNRAEFIHQIAEDAGDIILENQFLLIHTFEQLMAQAVHGLALLIHYVVVFEKMFAGFEVLGFNCFLCGLDAA